MSTCCTFNRTIVELKVLFYLYHNAKHQPFNRTIVELKELETSVGTDGAPAFNRTIVELKEKVDRLVPLEGDLLIVP